MKLLLILMILLGITLESCSRCSRSSLREKKRSIQQNDNRSNKSDAIGPAVQQPEIRNLPPAGTGQIYSARELMSAYQNSVFLILAYDSKNQQISQGTGFYIDENGYALSNYHVMVAGQVWRVRHPDGSTFTVDRIITSNQADDLSLFRVNIGGKKVKPVPVADTDPAIGEDILVIGNPRGLESTITKGIVSSIRTKGNDRDLIQVDAAISPGSSGSPVIDLYGRAIGIATMKIEECENCNFAVSWRRIRELIR